MLDGISLAASAANDDDDEEDYMRLIANLNLDVTAPSEKEVWEVKYNNVGFNVMVGAAAQNDGIKAAAKLIKKAKQAVAEQELRAREPVPAASIEAPMNPPKRYLSCIRDCTVC